MPLFRVVARSLLVTTLVGAVFVPLAASPAAAATLPAGFQEQIVFGGLSEPTNLEFAPDGRVFVAQKNGVIKVFDNLADPTPDTFADLSVAVSNQWDRGLLGLALAPNFPTNPWVYVLYTYDAPPGQTAPVWNDACPNPNGGDCLVTARLSRLQASGNQMTGSEQVLIGDWCQQYPSHSIGDLHFGLDGALYVSGGDGASFSFVDYGQTGNPINPCGDPPGGAMTPPTAEGGALRSQDVRTLADPTGLNGAILRLDPTTGAALPDNPLSGTTTDANARRIVGHGLRNPFRFTIRPGTNEVWAGDVGWNSWEEINRITTPTGGVTNFGWPCYEGAGPQSGYQSANLNLCQSLYSGAGQTGPYFTYNHGSKVVAGETCPTGGSAISGLAFYPAGGGPYPSTYNGALFFADYSRQCIWAMMPGTNGLPNPASIITFAAGAAQPVDLAMGPGGELYYADLGGTIRRIRYFPSNQPPVAVLGASPTSGSAPLTVNFTATGSTDADPADQGRLTYAWDFTNDGTVDATTATATHTYAAGTSTAKLTVTDTLGASDTTTVTISAGNDAPTAVIDTPSATLTWAVNDTISFSGHATDPQDGTLPSGALSWQVIMHHCATPTSCHTHVINTFAGIAGASIVAPDHEYPSYLEIVLTATDRGGLTSTASVALNPKTVDLRFDTSPSGLQLTVGSASQTTPFTRTVIQGSLNTLSAPTPQTLSGTTYAFSSWSDGGAQTHAITAPATATSYVANYRSTCGDSFGYTCTAGPRTFLAADQAVLSLTGDDAVQQISLPFAARLYGQSYSTAWVDTNGVISFVAPSGSAWNHGAIPSAPSAGTTNAAVYPFWDDLIVDSSSSVRTAVLGTAPNRQFVVEWRNVRFFTSTARVSFEVVLFENGDIAVAWKDIDATAIEQGGSATVGIENAAGTVALQYSLNTPALRTGNGVLFHPPAPGPGLGAVAGTVTDSATGAPIFGATVALAPGGLAATTGSDGTYQVGGVSAGSYTVTATAPGKQSASAPVTVGSGTSTVNLAPNLRDSFGYTITAGSRPWLAADQSVLSLTGDDAVQQISLPFAARLYGQSYLTAWVDTNGLLTFVAPSGSAWDHGAIPSAAATGKVNAAVYPFWDDLVVDSSSSVRTAVLGTAPNRQFVVEWRNVRFFNDAARVSFEVVLFENGDIAVAWKDIDAAAIEQGGSATVGIENAAGTVALQYSLNTTVLRTGNGVLFHTPA